MGKDNFPRPPLSKQQRFDLAMLNQEAEEDPQAIEEAALEKQARLACLLRAHRLQTFRTLQARKQRHGHH